MKRIAISFGAVAALAAAALFAAGASAQQELEGGRGARTAQPAQQAPPTPQQFQRGPGDVFERGPEGYRRGDDRDQGDWDRRRDRIDFQRAQESCSKAAIQEAWRRGFYSAQYEGGPRIEWDRGRPEMRGRMRLHDRRGYSYANTSCELRRNSEAADFDFLR